MLAASWGHRVHASRLLCYGAIVFGPVDLAIFLYPLGFVAGLAMLGWLRDSAGRPIRRTNSLRDDTPADRDVSLTVEALTATRSDD